jgi:hypothetical protein
VTIFAKTAVLKRWLFAIAVQIQQQVFFCSINGFMFQSYLFLFRDDDSFAFFSGAQNVVN